MANETSNWIPISLLKERVRLKASPKRDLRVEILQLRERLRNAEETASRHTIMLREGDHRIKNSRQIVVSLMALQANRESSEAARDALKAAAGRIQSIARIHDALQASEGANFVNLGSVLKSMCESLEAMAGDPGRIAVVVDAEDIEAPVPLAQSLALAVNELVVNALRHAFPADRPGVVHVVAPHRDDKLCITVADDGVGLPDGYTTGAGYGMKLVAMMVKQLGGELHVENSGGAKFEICAPLKCAAEIEPCKLEIVQT